ncbi:MAG: hypothetical protein M1294_05495 [Firmicutes bacterium]|nr:hypothetical protein [Bacillota bacterium]
MSERLAHGSDVFSARLYGKRSQEFRHKTKPLIDEMAGGKTPGEVSENGKDRHP